MPQPTGRAPEGEELEVSVRDTLEAHAVGLTVTFPG